MARSGKDSWDKYYSGNDGIQVTVKKSCQYYETESSKSSIGTLSPGTVVTYRDALSRHIAGGGNTRIAFQRTGSDDVFYAGVDFFIKPGQVSRIDLSPEGFGLDNQTFTATEYYNRLISSIADRWDTNSYSGELYDYLMELVAFANTGSVNSADLAKIKTQGFPWGAIQSFFGEVIGPLSCIKRNLLSGLGINLSTSTIFMPPSSIALYDYKLISGGQEYLISAKAGKGTANQVKPKFVIDAVDKFLPPSLKNSKAYQVLNAINDNSVKGGAFAAWKIIQPTTDGTLTDACIADVVVNYDTRQGKSTNKLANPLIWQPFVKKHLLNQNINNVTYGQVRYKCETLIQAASRANSLQADLKSIFEYYLNESRVIYVKLSIAQPSGQPTFNVMNVDGVKKINSLELRSSNDSQNRTADKIGYDKVR
jgi:hypothetical protein